MNKVKVARWLACSGDRVGKEKYHSSLVLKLARGSAIRLSFTFCAGAVIFLPPDRLINGHWEFNLGDRKLHLSPLRVRVVFPG